MSTGLSEILPLEASPLEPRPLEGRSLEDPSLEARLFPLFLDLRGRRVLVVGGGAVARRKVAALLDTGADVVVGAPHLDPALAGLVENRRITVLPGRFDPAWLDDAWLAIAASDDPVVNRAVAEAGARRRVPVNVVDDADASVVQLPAVVRRGPVQVAISSGGGAPLLARHLRELFEAQLDESLGAFARLLATQRDRIRSVLREPQARRAFFRRLLDGPVRGLLRRGDVVAAERTLLAELREAPQARIGQVALVGAGPGDPGLLTLRALRLLNEADVVLHDRLVDPGVLALARRDAAFVDVGKQAGARSTPQARIHALMIEHARAGRRVVRLKGGDPFVFGRGGEELQALRAAGIPFEVVPGITAALACAAYAGIPLTHRDHAQSLHLATAHRAGDGDGEPDWSALADAQQTLVFYMGVSGLARIRDRLIAHGRAAGTPFAIVEHGSRPEQRVIVGPLGDLPELATRHAVQSPALLIVGEVAAMAGQLHWFGPAPVGADSPAIGGSASADPVAEAA